VPEVDGVRVVVVRQLAEGLGHEVAQLRAVGDEAEQPEDAQPVEVGDGACAVQLTADVHGLAGLLVRPPGSRAGRHDARDAAR
jgi:hypothetical protein